MKLVKLKSNVEGVFVNFPKKFLYSFLKDNIKKNKKLIFNNNNYAYLTNVIFPRKNSRANTISIIEKKTFRNEKNLMGYGFMVYQEVEKHMHQRF